MKTSLLFLLAGLFLSTGIQAADRSGTRIGSTQAGQSLMTAPAVGSNERQAWLLAQSRLWGLTVEEMARAQQLMQPGTARAAFSSPNITPIEVLGIHAQNAAERNRYAELFAKTLRADTERVLAWSAAYANAYERLFPGDKVMDFGGKKLPPSQQMLLR